MISKFLESPVKIRLLLIQTNDPFPMILRILSLFLLPLLRKDRILVIFNKYFHLFLKFSFRLLVPLSMSNSLAGYLLFSMHLKSKIILLVLFLKFLLTLVTVLSVALPLTLLKVFKFLTHILGLARGQKVVDTEDAIKVPVGKGTLGRIMNVIGDPVDGKGPIKTDTHWSIHRDPPSFADQNTELSILTTGIKVVDLLAPYPKGYTSSLISYF